MKLFFSPGACSLSPHIILCESGLKYSVEKVNLRIKVTASGSNFLTINPKGQVPTLRLDSGDILTEGAAIVQYIADLVPEKQLLAGVGKLERYQTASWLNYIGTEIHKTYGPLFHSDSSDEAKKSAVDALLKKFTYVEEVLSHQDYIVTNHFTVADAYLFTVLRWKKIIKDLPSYPAIDKYMERIQSRPTVQKALKEEE